MPIKRKRTSTGERVAETEGWPIKRWKDARSQRSSTADKPSEYNLRSKDAMNRDGSIRRPQLTETSGCVESSSLQSQNQVPPQLTPLYYRDGAVGGRDSDGGGCSSNDGGSDGIDGRNDDRSALRPRRSSSPRGQSSGAEADPDHSIARRKSNTEQNGMVHRFNVDPASDIASHCDVALTNIEQNVGQFRNSLNLLQLELTILHREKFDVTELKDMHGTVSAENEELRQRLVDAEGQTARLSQANQTLTEQCERALSRNRTLQHRIRNIRALLDGICEDEGTASGGRMQSPRLSQHEYQSDDMRCRTATSGGRQRDGANSRETSKVGLVSPLRWTDRNPRWKDTWRSSLLFPPGGKAKAVVEEADIVRLDEGEYLNDNLITFYIRYLVHCQEVAHPQLASCVHFMSTFFYPRLTTCDARQKIDYDAVRKWTAKVNISSKRFIVVPIHENDHWYVVIIYNARRHLSFEDGTQRHMPGEKEGVSTPVDVEDSPLVLKARRNNRSTSSVTVTKPLTRTPDVAVSSASRHYKQSQEITEHSTKQNASNRGAPLHTSTLPERTSPCEMKRVSDSRDIQESGGTKPGSIANRHDCSGTRIVSLDSLNLDHPETCSNLQRYIARELMERTGLSISSECASMKARNLPLQSNSYDCGIFALSYIEKFLQDPDTFMDLITREDMEVNKWLDVDAAKMRTDIRKTIFKLQDEQKGRVKPHQAK